MLLHIALEKLTLCPLDGEEVQSGSSFADLDRAHDVGVLDALAVFRLSDEPRDRRLILAKFFSQHLHRHDTMSGMLGAEHSRRPTFAHLVTQGVSGDRLSDQVFFGHGANVTPRWGWEQATLGRITGATPSRPCQIS